MPQMYLTLLAKVHIKKDKLRFSTIFADIKTWISQVEIFLTPTYIPPWFIEKPRQKLENKYLIMPLPPWLGKRKKNKYKMCSDDLKQPFPNFLFSSRAIFFLFFLPEIKTKIRSFQFYYRRWTLMKSYFLF